MTDQEISDAQRRDDEVFNKHMEECDYFADRIAHKIDKMYDRMTIFSDEDSRDTIDMGGKFTVTIVINRETGNTELEFGLRSYGKYILPPLDAQTLRSCLHRMMFMKF